ncbi:single-stranded-DNA-specific exonuclease RecJ [Candidatus Kinetoplastidibacterium crithidiae]|uniref:Single-stranded-DNA-specific exonuclease RecJ n=1 Tax=Candidatus Kinetoplastidibacterium crithidiae TCC036E TaxID=1208918 RepID=M1L4E6_9PROT|nr:single-stranded-DNA-specific exonuclease RecJ [Candidatus Kinetoplastibacterium crithidii]AFZ82756.1 single-stranded-DNA-specific exonuclease [Candidatus Kinetoplastibacterium crithidii (ex Angomonas deanei ATCC 30255)]AGF47593.1 single-stranded-DNA-specific exonuclease [Candidatus Kinetoplastibacterium crithidii TCC036E]
MNSSYKIYTRKIHKENYDLLLKNGINPLLAKLFSSRGVTEPSQVQYIWSNLINPNNLSQIEKATNYLLESIIRKKRILIVADYDCDGATACALAVRALKKMGAIVNFIVPNRFNNNYGLSVDIIKQAYEQAMEKPDLIITVDNGISSIEGVEYARQMGIDVIVTDHHLPGKTLPKALAIINPNQSGCNFPSKNLAGVGVIFYLMIALRSKMRIRGIYKENEGPKLNELVDLVALGTVADLVKLDLNNRILVTQGLKRIQANKTIVGIQALFNVSNKKINIANSNDLGFFIAPKINAAGRLSDMSIGIRCLITDNYEEALDIAQKLNDINNERKKIEEESNLQAISEIDNYESESSNSICIYKENWNHGIVGLIASKLKEKYWKPTIAFAPSKNNELRGSGRSITGINIKEILDIISKKFNIIQQFGGHAMAAGLTITKNNYMNFKSAFEETTKNIIGNNDIRQLLETDGSLDIKYANTEFANLLNQQVWGSGFDEPLFIDQFEIISQKTLKNKHLKLVLQREKLLFDGIYFNHQIVEYKNIKAIYRIENNLWNDKTSLQLIIRLIIPND